MISKKDWRTIIRRLYCVNKSLKDVNHTLKIRGERVVSIDPEDDVIITIKDDNTRTVFMHPESFRNGLGLSEIEGAIQLSLDVKSSKQMIKLLRNGLLMD